MWGKAVDKSRVPKSVRAYLSTIGKRGGSAKGRSKARGDSAFYRALAFKRWGAPRQPLTR
jgi:hypothetical protein